MSYDKERDILNFYKYKCQKCPVKFLDAPSLMLHYKMMHGLIVKGFKKDRENPILNVIWKRKGNNDNR